MIGTHDKRVLRELARQVAEVAHLPIMQTRREMWVRHNRLERVRPLILVFPEGAWREFLPDMALSCVDAEARRIEWDLRARLYSHAFIHDDKPVEARWVVTRAIRNSGWGLEPERRPSPEPNGAWAFVPMIKSRADLDKLRFPEISEDKAETARLVEQAHELFDGLLDVSVKGVAHISFHLMSIYVHLRGLEQVMWDMYDDPAMLHAAMAFLEEGSRRIVQQYRELGLLSLNNDETYHSSGGVGYSEELPLADCDPQNVRPCDMWASAEAQEMAQVSPAMHAEFILQYEKRLLEPFGLNGYGCCEDLTDKLPDVLTIPRLRRISIAPSSDVARCAEQIGSRAILSWKPQPSHLVGGFAPEFVSEYIQHALDESRGCVFEMILKDTHTCEHHPERFTMWTDLAQRLAAQY